MNQVVSFEDKDTGAVFGNLDYFLVLLITYY